MQRVHLEPLLNVNFDDEISSEKTTHLLSISAKSSLNQPQRDNWSSRVVYLLSIIGFVVDLGRREDYS